jgi:hypothetical protein
MVFLDMIVELQELTCGGPGTIIDCNCRCTALCSFCKEYGSWFTEVKEVTAQELKQLIDKNKFIIKLIIK